MNFLDKIVQNNANALSELQRLEKSIENTYYTLRRKVSRFFFAVTGFLIAPFSYIVKKDKSLILIIPRASEGFEGNLKYFFLYLDSIKQTGVKAYYVAFNPSIYNELRSNNLPVLYHPSIKSIILFLRASVVVVDSGVWHKEWKTALTHKAKKIQLWHGNGIKRVGNYNKESQKNSSSIVKKIANKMEFAFPVYDTFVYTSQLQLKTRPGIYEYKEAFINGQTRNDIFFGARFRGMDIGCDRSVLDKIIEAKSSNKRVVMYAPTWRNEKFKPFTDFIDFAELNMFAELNNISIVIKLHPKDYVSIEEKKNIIIYDNKCDVYPAFPYTDCMITDYSSIYMDYLLTGKPVIFFPFDLHTYLSKRGVLYNYNEITPGPKVFSQKELQDSIRALLIDKNDLWKEERETITGKFNDYIDGNSCERLYKHIFE